MAEKIIECLKLLEGAKTRVNIFEIFTRPLYQNYTSLFQEALRKVREQIDDERSQLILDQESSRKNNSSGLSWQDVFDRSHTFLTKVQLEHVAQNKIFGI